MANVGNIEFSSNEKIFASLINPFRHTPDKKKKKYLIILCAIILGADLTGYLLVSWQGNARDIPFSSASIDLGDFKSRARRAPVIEIDEVFGNQFVKEKKDATPLPANEADGPPVDGESAEDLDANGTAAGGGAPNIARCAVRNFPAEAKAYVDEALVPIQITVDKTGLVRDAKPLHVAFKKELPPELKARMKTLFLNAARASLLGRRCPIYTVDGQARPYRLEVPLNYELYN